uniref:Uncharacterized protein n=1 Tax=Arundo donax TaxID=35708 RepID=A0A0A9ATN8_ARUDO
MMELQIGGAKNVDLELYNLENEIPLLICKIFYPIPFFSFSSLLSWRLD